MCRWSIDAVASKIYQALYVRRSAQLIIVGILQVLDHGQAELNQLAPLGVAPAVLVQVRDVTYVTRAEHAVSVNIQFG